MSSTHLPKPRLTGLGIVQRLCERNGWAFSLHADKSSGDGEITLKCSTTLALSRRHKDELKSRLNRR